MTVQATHRAIEARAVVYRARGGYEVIDVERRQVRAPGGGEVRIAVHAAAVNPTDLLLRDPGPGEPSFPVVPGMDAAGIVEAVGADVTRLRPGMAVMTAVVPRRPEGGAQTEYLVAPADSVVEIPAGVTLAQAATLPMNGLTALRALDLAGLAAGQTLAVSGGAGLLAHYAIAAAAQRGLRVIADARPDEIERVRGYGAHTVVARGSDFAGAVRRKWPDGVDALLDTAVLGESAFAAIRDGGVYLPVRGWGGEPAARGIQVRPVFVHEVLGRTAWLEQLRDWVAAGHIALQVAGEYAPEQTADAQRSLAAGGLRGRPVIVFAV